jgi:hypothetical protein
MFLQKYLQTIEQVNPDRIYVENVRSFFNVPRIVAKLLCEIAVVDKSFKKKIGYICPVHKHIIAGFSENEQVPETIICDICEGEECTTFEYKTSDLNTIEFYQLLK